MRTSVHRNPDALEVGPISAAVGVAPAQQSYLQLRIQLLFIWVSVGTADKWVVVLSIRQSSPKPSSGSSMPSTSPPAQRQRRLFARVLPVHSTLFQRRSAPASLHLGLRRERRQMGRRAFLHSSNLYLSSSVSISSFFFKYFYLFISKYLIALS